MVDEKVIRIGDHSSQIIIRTILEPCVQRKETYAASIHA